MLILFIKGKTLSRSTWPCVEKIKNIISHKNFISCTQAWLLSYLLNQEIKWSSIKELKKQDHAVS